jgi:hypothetical protein
MMCVAKAYGIHRIPPYSLVSPTEDVGALNLVGLYADPAELALVASTLAH